MLGLFHNKALGDEQRELHVGMTGCLDPIIECTLHQFPDRPAVGLNDDTTTDNFGNLGQISFPHNIEVPLVVINTPLGNNLFWHAVPRADDDML